jgi:hypothetical protein
MKTFTLPQEDWNRIAELLELKAESYARDYARAVDYGNDHYAEVLYNESAYFRNLAHDLSS